MQNMKWSEVLDFLKRDYPEYAWSLPTRDRRMRYFDIKYINYETTVDEVVAAFNTENGPGQLLGYRALHKNLREQHGLAVLRVFSPTQRDQSSSVGRRRYDDGMSSGVGTWEECWKTEKNERSSWNVHFIGMCKEKTLQQKIHLVIFWVPGAHGNCNPVN